MFDALHPTSSEMISYLDFLKYALDLNYSKPNDAPLARCPVCKRAMKVRAGKTKDDGHFYHNDEFFCPTKDPASRPYIKLTPTHSDQAAIIKNRDFAATNMNFIYSKTKNIVPFLDFKEFIEILIEAKRLNVYGYTNLIAEYLPYVYVTLINFLPRTSYQKSRRLKFCFFYQDNIQSIDDLWINKGFSSDLFRISYHNGTTQKVTKIETTINYLTDNQAKLTAKQIQWCLAVL